MNRRVDIAARIERNRIALLRLLFCWLAVAFLLRSDRDRRLPRRLGAFVQDLLSRAETATRHLLVAAFHNSQAGNRRFLFDDKWAHHLSATHAGITIGARTIPGVIARLKRLQSTLHNLHAVARGIARAMAAKMRVEAIKCAALATARSRAMPNRDSGCAASRPRALMHPQTIPP